MSPPLANYNGVIVCVCPTDLCNKNFDPSWVVKPPRLTDAPPLLSTGPYDKKQLGAPA